MSWVVLAEEQQGANGSRTALAVRIIDHDAVEALSRVQVLQPGTRAHQLVRGPATVVVLQREQDIDGVVQEVVGQTVADDVTVLEFEAQGSAQTFSSAVSNGPSVISVGEGPSTLGDVTVVLVHIRRVLQDL